MAVIFAETVAITKSRLAKGFNGDNLNLNGKVLSLQEADNGFKAAGRVKTPYISVIASGNQKGFASGAVLAFNDYVKDINLNKYNAETVIGRYFDDMQSVVEKCGIDESKLSMGIICAYDDCVIAAKLGDCHLLRFSEGELFEIALSDDESGKGYQFIDVVADGEIFALIGEEAAADLDYDGIVNIFDSQADLKTMIKDFYNLLSDNAPDKDCSVVLIKLNGDAERTYAATPLVSSDVEVYEDSPIPVSPDSFASEPPVETDELRKADDFISDEENPETGKRPDTLKKKILSFIPIVILVILLAVAAAFLAATLPDRSSKEGSSEAGDILGIEGESYDFNGSNGMQNVEDTEHGGLVFIPEQETTTNAEMTSNDPEVTTDNITDSPEIITDAENSPVDTPVENESLYASDEDAFVNTPVEDATLDEPVDEEPDDIQNGYGSVDTPPEYIVEDPFADEQGNDGSLW